MRQGKRVDVLERRLAELEEELRGGLENVVGEAKTLREEHARSMRHVERRLVALEAGRDGTEGAAAGGPEHEPSKGRYIPPREYPQLVTQEAEPDEERVYGAATPVIVEWRKAKAEFSDLLKTGTALAQAEAKMRMLRLEIAIIEEHELTLPPASYLWNWESRRQQVRRREQSLGSAEVHRNRALLRLWAAPHPDCRTVEELVSASSLSHRGRISVSDPSAEGRFPRPGPSIRSVVRGDN